MIQNRVGQGKAEHFAVFPPDAAETAPGENRVGKIAVPEDGVFPINVFRLALRQAAAVKAAAVETDAGEFFTGGGFPREFRPAKVAFFFAGARDGFPQAFLIIYHKVQSLPAFQYTIRRPV